MLRYSQPTTLIDCIRWPDDQRGRRHLIVAHKRTSVADPARAPLIRHLVFYSLLAYIIHIQGSRSGRFSLQQQTKIFLLCLTRIDLTMRLYMPTHCRACPDQAIEPVWSIGTGDGYVTFIMRANFMIVGPHDLRELMQT